MVHKKSSPKFQCSECPYVTTKEQTLEDHNFTVHEGKHFSCDACEFKADTRAKVLGHMRRHHSNVSDYLMCDKCDFKDVTETKLQKHMINVHCTEKIACEECSEQFRSSSGLNQHKRQSQHGMRHSCSKCMHKTNSLKGMRKHIVNTHKEEL